MLLFIGCLRTPACEYVEAWVALRLLLRELKMPILSQQKDEITKNTQSLSSEGDANKARCRISAAALRQTASLPQGCKDKVLAVLQQLAQGTYDPYQRLDAVLDSLLADLAM